ncbi:hypothetical protein N8996_01815 [Candidatus Poseidonia alphae]|nr:hypothetical protein [Candidatus Poseidonia alphae]
MDNLDSQSTNNSLEYIVNSKSSEYDGNNNLSLPNKPIESPEYLEKLNEYYNLKKTYETNIKDKKNTILKDDSLSIMQKKEKINKMKKTCIICKSPGGSVFKNEGTLLLAYCGNSSPCNFKIKINRGTFVLLNETIDVFNEGVEEGKENIIKSKLNLLFNLEKEEDVLKYFNEVKDELTEDLESLVEFKQEYLSKIENLGNNAIIIAKTKILEDKILLIKEAVVIFNETNEKQYVKDIVNIYIDDILPLNKELQDLKYKYYNIESFQQGEETIFKLIKKKYTIENLLSVFSNPEIIEFDVTNSANAPPVPNDNDDDDDNDDNDDENIVNDVSLDLSKLNKTQKNTKPTEDKIIVTSDGDVKFGDKLLTNNKNYEKNKSLQDSLPEISAVEVNNKKYIFQMLYISPSSPVLFAIDPNNGDMYVVDVATKKTSINKDYSEDEDEDEDEIPPPPPSPETTST